MLFTIFTLGDGGFVILADRIVVVVQVLSSEPFIQQVPGFFCQDNTLIMREAVDDIINLLTELKDNRLQMIDKECDLRVRQQ